jgi:hypothetical protein
MKEEFSLEWYTSLEDTRIELKEFARIQVKELSKQLKLEWQLFGNTRYSEKV